MYGKGMKGDCGPGGSKAVLVDTMNSSRHMPNKGGKAMKSGMSSKGDMAAGVMRGGSKRL